MVLLRLLYLCGGRVQELKTAKSIASHAIMATTTAASATDLENNSMPMATRSTSKDPAAMLHNHLATELGSVTATVWCNDR